MNTYANLGQITSRTGPLPKPPCWRMVTNLRPGQITGIPSIAGTPIATNGIHVVLENETGRLAIGHFDWFEQDKPEPKAPVRREPKVRAPRLVEALSLEFV